MNPSFSQKLNLHCSSFQHKTIKYTILELLVILSNFYLYIYCLLWIHLIAVWFKAYNVLTKKYQWEKNE